MSSNSKQQKHCQLSSHFSHPATSGTLYVGPNAARAGAKRAMGGLRGCCTANSMSKDMGDRGSKMDHGGFRSHSHIGSDASQGAQVLDDEGAAAQQVWDGAAVQVGHDQGHACSCSRWRHKCDLQHQAFTPLIWAYYANLQIMGCLAKHHQT